MHVPNMSYKVQRAHGAEDLATVPDAEAHDSLQQHRSAASGGNVPTTKTKPVHGPSSVFLHAGWKLSCAGDYIGFCAMKL